MTFLWGTCTEARVYNEELANSILAKLDELFPTTTSSGDLQEFQVQGFQNVPRKVWLEALDALLKLGLISGNEDREGPTLRYVVNLLITARGREEFRKAINKRTSSATSHSNSRLIFLSHAARDQEIAIHLKRVIENAIPGSDVFVSSDTEDLRPGDEWVRKIWEKLKEARMLVILSTDRSLSRPWVWYEMGAGFGSDLRIIPCCVGTIRKNQLPAPFSSYQAVNADDEDLVGLLTSVSREVNLPLQLPQTLSIIAELEKLDQWTHDSGVSVPAPDETQRRVDLVDVSARIEQGRAENFIILLENESDEAILVREIRLLSQSGVRLSEPHLLGSKEPNKLEPRGKLQVAWRAQQNPAATLMFMRGTVIYSQAERQFDSEIEISVTCDVLGKIKRCPNKLRVQVDVMNHFLTQIAG